ncbi:Conserved_hypothetical protein [Hexamita inflata]|uniref:Uncharacterized protein n=1 Tax=Hexamita inflata TaxID=28002 RepID=A0AA86PKZ9_9EUKA|nr:Conserved hypothetical protein [Hexamita inflata]
MLLINLALLDLPINQKQELYDCYNASSYIRLVTIRSKRFYRLYITPTGKPDCSQLPRGVNVTVFANKLIDVNNNFIPTSYVIYNFSYTTTIGINVQCLKCTSDTYLSSDQVIVTIESATQYTKIVMGSVLTEKGLQLNCFQSSRTTIDIDYIQLQVSNSNNCPQLISTSNSNNMKNLISADIFIIYLNGDIDRYEKLEIGTQFKTFRSPPSWGATNTFNATISNIGLKPLKCPIYFILFQLYFQSMGATIMTSIQVNNYTVIQLLKAYSNISLKVQGSSAYVDLTVNSSIVSGSMVYQNYNNQLSALQYDAVQIQFFGYSSRIPSTCVLDGTQVTSSVASYYQEPSMSFTFNEIFHSFQSTRIRINCQNVIESDCEQNLQRFLRTNDSTFQFNMILRYFKNDELVKVMNQNVNQISESCFNGANVVVYKSKVQIQIGANQNSKCNMSGKINISLSAQNESSIITLSYVEFSYDYSVPLTIDQAKLMQEYIKEQTKGYMLQFYINGTVIDFVQVDKMYISQQDLYRNQARKVIYIVGVSSIVICVIQQLAPRIAKTLRRIIVKYFGAELVIINMKETQNYDL